MANGLWIGSVNDSVSRLAAGSARITVTDPESGNLLGLYADREGTKPLGNPFLTREDGLVKFFVRAGRINIDATKAGKTSIFENEIVADDWPNGGGGPTLPTESRLLLLNEANPYLPVWDLPAFDNYQELTFPGSTIFFTCSAARDGQLVALGGQLSPYWKLLDGSLADITPSVVLANRCFAISVSVDGKWIAAAHHESSPYITVIDVESSFATAQPVAAPSVRPDSNGRVAWNSDASLLALAGSAAPRLLIYNMPSFTAVSPGPSAIAPASSIVFNADGTILYAGFFGDDALIAYSTSDWSLIGAIDSSEIPNGVACLAYSAALGLLAAGDLDGNVFVIDIDTLTVIATDDTYAVGGNGTTSVSFSYDDTALLATHNFSPFAVVYNMPAFTESSFDPNEDSNLEYLDGGLFIPRPDL